MKDNTNVYAANTLKNFASLNEVTNEGNSNCLLVR